MENFNDFSFASKLLTNGEQILWQGKPGSGNLIGKYDSILIPASILWCGFAIFWEIDAIVNFGDLSLIVPGIFFVLIGLYLVFGRFLYTSYMRERTSYVITNYKIIRNRNGKIDFLDKRKLPAMSVYMFKNGYGTIHFGHHNPISSGYLSFSQSGMFSLENIPDPIAVQQIINQF